MDWSRLDLPTRVGVVAAVVAVVGLLVPPLSVASALTAIGFSGYAWRRSHGQGEANRVARLATIGCVALVVLLVAGSAVYAAN